MIRLLIADDEKIIRETICTIIDWKSLNIEVVGVCKNGLEAYDAILDEYPDIVLTDIRMPKLSGLELIQKITQNHDNIQFIILSGYNEFSYAKEAMRYGIKHYITKPCNESEIMEAVKDAIKEHYKKLSVRNLETGMNTGNSRLLKNLMYDMLLQLLSSDQELEELPAIYETHLDFHHTAYQVCFLYFLEEHLVISCIEQIQNLLRTNEIPCSFTYIYVKNTLTFFFVATQKNYDRFDELMENLEFQELTIPYLYQRESYSCLLSLLDKLSRKVKRYEIIYLYSGSQPVTICNYDSLFQQVLYLADSLMKETSEVLHKELLEELKNLLSTVKNLELLRSLINSLLLKAIQTSSAYKATDITEFMLFIGTITSNTEICSFIFEKLDTIYPTPMLGTGKYKPFIQEILNYTKEHISDPELTLKWIVENHLFMNVDYVSRQFVLQTGIKFSTYLNSIRIKKAKHLLINCDSEKIYYVAEQVGCGNNPQYFSHLFKKYTKMTPKEYIQKMKHLNPETQVL